MIKHKIFQVTLVLLGYISFTYAQGNWELLMPQPTSNQMVALYFVDAQTGWSVGEYGTILKSIDGGENWSITEIPWLFDLSDVYFPTAQTGYAVGTDGFIIKSTDGGESWEQLDNKYSNNLNRVLFKDEETGWVIGEKGLILRTIDGGATWSQQVSGSGEHLYGITFIGQEKMIVVGNNNTILLTENKGTDWVFITKSKYSDYNYRDVYFANESTGWIGGEYSDIWGCILRTVNGGKSWSDQSSTSNVQIGDNGSHYRINLLGSIQQVWFSNDMRTGICFTRRPLELSNGEINFSHVYTQDGGVTWNGFVDGYSEGYNEKGRFQFLNDSMVIATGYGGDFRFSDNRGRTWQYKNLQDRYWNDFMIAPDGSLHIIAPEGGDYSLKEYVSQDKGETWTSYTSTISFLDGTQTTTQSMGEFGQFTPLTGGNLYQCYYCRPDKQYSVLCSEDLGKSYYEIRRGLERKMYFLTLDTLVYTELRKEEIQSHVFQSVLYCWYSFDGGVTIQNQTFTDIWNDITSTDFPLALIGDKIIPHKYFFLNGRVGFLVGTDGNILRTEDTGQSWTNIYSGVVENLRDIEFINHQTGFVVGDFGRVLKSEDGGLTWRKTNSGTQEDVYCISFINENEGWIGTESGMRYTKDGGETWHGIPLPYQHGPVYNIEFDPYHNGYALSLGGYNSQCPGTYVKFQRMTDYSTDIDDENNDTYSVPEHISLSPNYPNPFNSNTTIEYLLPLREEVQLKIFDIQGRLVRTLVSRSQESGAHSAVWNGVSDAGLPVSSGVYIYQLECGEQVKRQKLLLLK